LVCADLNHGQPAIASSNLDAAQISEADAGEQQAGFQSAGDVDAAIDRHRAGVMQVELDAKPLGVVGERTAEGGGAGVEIHGVRSGGARQMGAGFAFKDNL
jgi:hypothetical protein